MSGAPDKPSDKVSTFAALGNRNYRIYISGQVTSMIGLWVQRISQDWLVLELTGSPAAVGITAGLQLLPTMLFGLWAAVLADRYPKRWNMVVTQSFAGLMATMLAVVTLTGHANVWWVYVTATGLGLTSAFDNPVRHTFVGELVGRDHLRNAVSLNASVIQSARLVGPLLAALLIDTVGSGWSFALNAASYVVVIAALLSLRESEMHFGEHRSDRKAKLSEGFRYLFTRIDLVAAMLLAMAVAGVAANIPVMLAAFAKYVFETGAGGYGVMMAAAACGAVVGGLLSARAKRARLRNQIIFAFGLGILTIVNSSVGNSVVFSAVLVVCGGLQMLFLTTSNVAIQLGTEERLRGRVLGIYMQVFWAVGAVAGPAFGYVAQHWSPRTAMMLGGLIPLVASVLVALWVVRRTGVKLTLRAPATVAEGSPVS